MKMLPASALPSNSPAELRIFRLLQAIELPEWVALHSLNLPIHGSQRSGECDFVLIGPKGVLVLEVKGGGIAVNGAGQWSTTGQKGTSPLPQSPFRQAEKAMHALKNQMIAKHLKDVHFAASDPSKVLWCFGVVFPDTDFTIESVEWSSEVIADNDDIDTPAPFKRYLLQTFEHYEARDKAVGRAPGPRLAASDIKAYVNTMRPIFEVGRSLRSDAEQIDERLTAFTDEQYLMLDFVEDVPRLLIEGGAGTGKTFLAAEIAHRHASRGQKVLLVVFSPLLAAFIRDRLLTPNVKVISIHQLMLDTIRASGVPRPEGYYPTMPLTDPWFQKDLIPAFEVAAASIKPEQQMDVLIIDEAQDVLNEEYLLALEYFLKGGLKDGCWRVFYDHFNQGPIFGNFNGEALDLLKGYGSIPPRVLHRNCRNTAPILNYTKRHTGTDLETSTLNDGPEVVSEHANSDEQAAGKLQQMLEALERDSIDGRYVTILSPMPQAQSCVKHLPIGWRKKILELTSTDGASFPSRQMTFSTIAGFKGLENRFILVVDIPDSSTDPRERANQYIGFTRARVKLWVCYLDARPTAPSSMGEAQA